MTTLISSDRTSRADEVKEVLDEMEAASASGTVEGRSERLQALLLRYEALSSASSMRFA